MKSYKQICSMVRTRLKEMKYPEPICTGTHICLICGNKMPPNKADCTNDKKHQEVLKSNFNDVL